ncbi:HD-GYP domain-containing protein [Parasulfuritortus cantonensis]|nr:HD domain-containing phosphohydrolase [Parasulfuritortus cantonensis]
MTNSVPSASRSSSEGIFAARPHVLEPARSIRRALIRRLALAAVVLATVLGAGAFVNESRQLDSRFAETLRFGAELLRLEVDRQVGAGVGSAAAPPVQAAIDALLHDPPRSDMGRFVFAAFFDASRREVARGIDRSQPDAVALAAAYARQGFRFPGHGLVLGGTLGLGQRPALPFAMAVADGQGRTVGYINGIFVLSPAAEAELFRSARRAALVAVVLVLVTALFIYPILRGLVGRLGELSLGLLAANVDTVKVLGSAIAKRDSDTEAHNYRVTLYAVLLAEAAGLDDRAIRGLIKGAFLHDVGKIGIRDAILLKPGPLDPGEFAAMQEHVHHGLDILRGAPWLADAAVVVGGHHERYDGSGYPLGLKGDAIPLVARVFSVADVFDALTSVRPYKPAYDLDSALATLRHGAGRAFEPALVTLFAHLVPPLYAVIGHDEAASRELLEKVARRYYRANLREIVAEVAAATARAQAEAATMSSATASANSMPSTAADRMPPA